MAILKYTTADGTIVKLNSYKVNNLVPVQSKGDNPNAVMSQKATTDELNAIGLQIDEATGKITALTSTVNGKANKTDLTSEINRAKAAEKANSDRITELENNVIIDCGEY